MKTVIIGGGKGCCAIIDLALGPFLRELVLDIECVVDIDANAPGMICARDRGIRTTTDIDKTLATPGLELILELTGSDAVLEKIYKRLPPGVKIIDHTFAHIFWDLVNAQEERNKQLEEMTALERKVERERMFLQSLFDTIPDLAVVLNREQRVVKANASFAKFVDMTPAETIGRTIGELFSDTAFATQHSESVKMIDNVFKTGKPHTVIWRTGFPHETYWEVTRTPIVRQDGSVLEILGTWHKITERVKLRREIESAEQRFKSFIDSANDWISIKDLNGHYIIVNPAIAKAFRHDPADFIGRRADDILPAKLASTIKHHDMEVIETKRHQRYEEIINIDGQDHHFQTVRFPLTDYKGTMVGVCTIARDITSEKDLQNQLFRTEKLAAVGRLAAEVAHEINNPLTGVLAYAEDMLDDLPEDDSHRDDVKVIIRETLRCRDIVRNLLDFARQETPDFALIDPNVILDEALLLVQRLSQFRNITIEKVPSRDVPQIKCDVQQIQQVLLNLMLNAADAMQGRGIILLSTSYERNRNSCVITVEDSGPGIPSELVTKIFEPFFSTKGSNGLGLAVSRGIVQRHGGSIDVEMPESGGAIFRIVLPA